MPRLHVVVLFFVSMGIVPPHVEGQAEEQPIFTASARRGAEHYELSIQAYLPGSADKDIAEIELRRWHFPTRAQNEVPVWSYRVRVQKARFTLNEKIEAKGFEAGRYLMTVKSSTIAPGGEGGAGQGNHAIRAFEIHREVWFGTSEDRMQSLENHGKMLWQDTLDVEQMVEECKAKEKFAQNWSKVFPQVNAKQTDMGNRTYKSWFTGTYDRWGTFFTAMTEQAEVDGVKHYDTKGLPLTEIPAQKLLSILNFVRQAIALDYIYVLIVEAQGLEGRLELVISSDGVRYTEAYRKEFHRDFMAIQQALDAGIESGFGPILKKLPEVGENMKDVISMMKSLEASVAEGITKEDAAKHVAACKKIRQPISLSLHRLLAPKPAAPSSPSNE